MAPTAVSPEEYRRAAKLRVALRHLERETERVAPKHGLTPRRHLLLLAIKGAPDGREDVTIGELADRVLLAQNTVIELVDRMEEAGLVRRERAADDARVVHVRVTREGERRLARVVREARRRAGPTSGDREAVVKGRMR